MDLEVQTGGKGEGTSIMKAGRRKKGEGGKRKV